MLPPALLLNVLFFAGSSNSKLELPDSKTISQPAQLVTVL